MVNNLRKIRISRGLSQTDLGALLGIPNKRISEWENDHKRPSLESLLNLCKVLNCKLEDLFTL